MAFIPKGLIFLALLPVVGWSAGAEYMALQACLLKEKVNLDSFEVKNQLATADLSSSASQRPINELKIRACLQESLPSDQNALIIDNKLYLKLADQSKEEKFYVQINRARQTKSGKLEAVGTCSPSPQEIQIVTNLERFSTPCLSGEWYFLSPKKKEKFKYILLAYRNYIKEVAHDFRHLE